MPNQTENAGDMIDEVFRRVSTVTASYTPRFRDGDILHHNHHQYRAVRDSYICTEGEVVDVVTHPREGMPITRNSVRLFKLVEQAKPKKGGLTSFLEKHS